MLLTSRSLSFAVALLCTTLASTASAAPAGWTCNAAYYGANDGCDCGCGVPDPDCGGCAGCTTRGCVTPGCDFCYNGLSYSCGANRDAYNYVGPQTQPGTYVANNAKNVCCGRSCGTVRQAVVSVSRWIKASLDYDRNCIKDRFTATADQLISGQFKCFEGCTTFTLEFVALARALNIPCEIVETVGVASYYPLTGGEWPCMFHGHAFARCKDTNGAWFYYNPVAEHFPTVSGSWLSAPATDPNGPYIIRDAIRDYWDEGVRGATDWEQWIKAAFCPNGQCLPECWTCPASYYSTNDGCDCGCGFFDQDCGDYDRDRGCIEHGCSAPQCRYNW